MAEAEPTELEIVKYLHKSSDSMDRLAWEMFKTVNAVELQRMSQANAWSERQKFVENYARYSDRPDFMDFVRHVIKVERIKAKLKAEDERKRKQDELKVFNREHACPVCSEIAFDNSKYHPCHKCQLVINTKLTHTKDRERMVDSWLKSNAGSIRKPRYVS